MFHHEAYLQIPGNFHGDQMCGTQSPLLAQLLGQEYLLYDDELGM